MTIPVFKIRCSAIGQIMTEPRSKSVREKIADLTGKLAEQTVRLEALKPGTKSYGAQESRIGKTKAEIASLILEIDAPNLSETCKSYLKKWLNEHLYQRRIEFYSKQTTKGDAVEDDAITYASAWVDGMRMAVKNTRHFENDWLTGTPDVVNGYIVFDTKASYTHDTFPLYESEIPELDYDWQVKGYCELTGAQRGAVVFVLMSMPEDMIEREARWRLGQEFTREQYQDFAAQYRYDDLPPHLRLKVFPVERDLEAIEAVKKRVEECRAYIAQVLIPAVEKNEAAFLSF